MQDKLPGILDVISMMQAAISRYIANENDFIALHLVELL